MDDNLHLAREILVCRPYFLGKLEIRHSFLICYALALTLLNGGQVSCQIKEKTSTVIEALFVTSLTPACDPDVQECKDRIMAQERESEIVFRSSPYDLEITIQELKQGAQKLPVPGAVNFYDGEASFGPKPRFQKRTKVVNWRPFLSEFELRGFAEMCCLDPLEFNGTNYELEYLRDEMLLGRYCWTYRVKPKENAKGWHFAGTIWVLPDSLAIVVAEGAFHPMRKNLWLFPAEDHWFSFDSWRKEISPGNWVPDFTCTGVAVPVSDFTNPAFSGQIVFHHGTETQPSAAAEHACGMESVPFPTHSMQPRPGTGQIHK
jgi:hypothetical protein